MCDNFMKLILNERILNLSDTQIMGILNMSPDSFFDGGVYSSTVSKAIDHVDKMITCGATLIDIGGESTRPGSVRVSESEELDRVLPVVHEVMKRFDVVISVNTSSALVMRECSMLGVHLINDVRSLESSESIKIIASSKMAICLTHMQGNPKTMNQNPVYSDVVYEINDFFTKQIIRCEESGIDRTRLLLDPGFGFGKTIEHNYQLLSSLQHFHHFCLPVLVGISRKSMINAAQLDPKKKLIGSVVCSVIAAMQGVHIVRVHDVPETMDALKIVKIIKRLKQEKEDECELS